MHGVDFDAILDMLQTLRSTTVLYELRQQMSIYLAAHQTCILCCSAQEGNCAVPVAYQCQGVQVTCLLPRWADAAYYLELDPRVLLIIPDGAAPPLRWLQIHGLARLEPYSAEEAGRLAGFVVHAPDSLYHLVAVAPQRADWVDESRRWGLLETLDF